MCVQHASSLQNICAKRDCIAVMPAKAGVRFSLAASRADLRRNVDEWMWR
jgi:hypothetical protein